MASPKYSQAQLVHRLKRLPMQAVASTGVRELGYDPQARMAAVVFAGSELRYGYPNLSNEEVAGLLRVMESQASIGHYISTVIKANHDFEHVRSDGATLRLVA
jgi:hypothetical protein